MAAEFLEHGTLLKCVYRLMSTYEPSRAEL